jgi:VCBS repeat protein
MRAVSSALVVSVLLSANLLAQSPNPVPFVNQPLLPTSVPPGGPGFALTVNGTGFVSGSVVNWNGQPRKTTFTSSSQLSAAISASDIATPGSAAITVKSPSPGGGRSNVVPFQITVPAATPGFFGISTHAAESGTAAVFAGDFNGDGIPDLAAIASSGSVSIFLGNGDGTFKNGPVYYTGVSQTTWVTGGDFNGDGKLDLAVTGTNCEFVPCPPGVVSILLGKGDGAFQPAVNYRTAPEPFIVTVADMNGDGKLDLVTGNNCAYNCDGPRRPCPFFSEMETELSSRTLTLS